jgi:chromate transporter
MIYLDLLIGFLEVGLFSFGGAYAAIPLIRDVVLAHGWMDDEMISYMIAVSESTPGPIMVNLATYIGSNKGGLLGAVIATTAVVLPAFFIILIIMGLAKNLLKNPYTQAILTGLKSCVIGVILATGAYMILGNCGVTSENGIDITAILITIGLSIVYYGMRKVRKNGISPIGLICIAAVVGVAVYGI